MFFLSILFLIVFVLAFLMSLFLPIGKKLRLGSFLSLVISIILFAFSMFTVVNVSRIGIQSTFGKVNDQVLNEGAHFILPWVTVHEVLASSQQATSRSEAASKDMQVVFAGITLNYNVLPSKARELYSITPRLDYEKQFVEPAMNEVFKAIVARYTAEELVTKRSEVSDAMIKDLQNKLSRYYISVNNLNIVEFNFSKSFNAAIEEKVTATQKALTAERDLERAKFVAQQRIEQARGEAEAIRIQSEAITKNGGAEYVKLQAIQKWDGKLPQYSLGNSTPIINLGN